MILKTIQSATDLPFKGVELVKVDKTIREVIIGGKLRIRVASTYSNQLELLTEAPFESAKRYRMTATVDGFDPKVEYFEQRWEADTAKNGFIAKGVEAEVDEIEVQIDDAGNVVAPANDPVPVKAAQEEELIPF